VSEFVGQLGPPQIWIRLGWNFFTNVSTGQFLTQLTQVEPVISQVGVWSHTLCWALQCWTVF